MEDDIRPSFEILLKFFILDKHFLGVAEKFFKAKQKNSEAAQQVSSALKTHHIGLITGILETKPNLSLTKGLLHIVFSETLTEEETNKKLTYEEIKDKINIKNAAGYLAFFIYKRDADSAAKAAQVLLLENSTKGEALPPENANQEQGSSKKEQQLKEKSKALQKKKSELEAKLAAANTQNKKLSDDNYRLKAKEESYTESYNTVLQEKERLQQNYDSLREQVQKLEINIEENKIAQKSLEMQAKSVHKTSLGIVQVDEGGKKFVFRLADVDEDKLVPFESNESIPKTFENRNRIYNDSYLDDAIQLNTIGIWDWTAEVNYRYPDKSKDYTSFRFRPDLQPIEIINTYRSRQEVVQNLIRGFTHPYADIAKTIFLVLSDDTDFLTAVLLPSNYLVHNNDLYFIRQDICSLNKYILSKTEIHCFRDINNRAFYMKIELKEPVGKIMICTKGKAIAKEIAKITMKDQLEAFKISRQQKQKMKEFLANIVPNSIYQNLQQDFNWSLEDSKKYVKKYSDDIARCLEGTDDNTNLMSYIVEHNSSMNQKYQAIIEDNWRRESSAKIAFANSKVENLNREILELQRQENNISSALDAKKKQVDSLEEQLKNADEVGRKAQQIVKEKIQSARADASEFLAEMSFFFLPDKQIEAKSVNRNLYTSGRALDEDKIKQRDNDGILESISVNFEKVGVKEELSHPLAAYFLAAFFTKIPLLLAGPAASELSDAFSTGLTGNFAARLVCTDTWDEDAVKQATASDDEIIKVENPFSIHWIDHLPQTVWSADKLFLYMTPFKEDLTLEPAGLYNYMLPLFTENFVNQAPTQVNYIGSQWRGEISKTHVDTYSSTASILKELKLSTLVFKNVEKIVSCFKELTKAASEYNAALFCYLPLAYVTRANKETIENILTECQFSEDEINKLLCAHGY